MVEAKKADDARDTDELLDELAELVRDARRLGEKAEAIGDCKGALMGVRERARIAELKARIAGRIAGAKVEINLNSVNVELLPDAALEEFLERAKDRVERFFQRKLNDLVAPEQYERIHRAELARRIYEELGCFVEYEEVLEIIRAAKADDIERMKRAQEANLTSARGRFSFVTPPNCPGNKRIK
jgi:hypothetical protein